MFVCVFFFFISVNPPIYTYCTYPCYIKPSLSTRFIFYDPTQSLDGSGAFFQIRLALLTCFALIRNPRPFGVECTWLSANHFPVFTIFFFHFRSLEVFFVHPSRQRHQQQHLPSGTHRPYNLAMLSSIFSSVVRPRMAASSLRATTATTSLMTPLTAALQPTRPATVDSARTLLKTHKGAAKRWRKTANGYKRVC